MPSFEDMYKKMEEEAQTPNRYTQKSSFEADPRFYRISKNQEGDGTVVIRFLPSFNKDRTQLNTYLSKKVHKLQWERHIPGKDKPERRWKAEFMCPKTISKDEECPVCNYGWDMYNSLKDDGEPKDKYDVYRRTFTNQEKILTNILIIKDDVNPENNGKVFLFELSKTVLNMFQPEVEAVRDMSDEDRKASGIPDSMKAFDPFNIMCSRNMTLKFLNRKKVNTPSDYWGSSRFSIAFTGIASSIEEAQKIVEQTYCLDDEVDAKHLISMDQMQSNLDYVLFKDKKTKKENPAQTSKDEVGRAPSQVDMDEVGRAPSQVDMNEMLKSAPAVNIPTNRDEETMVKNEPIPKPKPKVEKTPEPKVEHKQTEEELLASLGIS